MEELLKRPFNRAGDRALRLNSNEDDENENINKASTNPGNITARSIKK